MRIYDLLLEQPPSQARWANCLAEDIRWLETELATRRQVDAELEALRTLAACVQDLLLEGRIDKSTAHGVYWRTRSMLVAALLHFLEL
jgi:hypothetical protein